MEERERKPIEDEVVEEEKKVIDVGSRVNEAMRVYQAMMNIPNEIKLGKRTFFIYPKSRRHIAIIGMKLIEAVVKFDKLRELGETLFARRESDPVASVTETLVGHFDELFDFIVDIFAVVLNDEVRPTEEKMAEIKAYLEDYLTVPDALLIFTIFIEQNNILPFVKIFRQAHGTITM